MQLMQTEESNLYIILEHLQRRKALYLGNGYNFKSLDAFISGFTMAASDRQLELEGVPNFNYFNTWILGHLEKHFGETGGWHWQISSRNLNNDEKAFEDFFQFLEIFKSSTIKSKSIIVDNEAIEFSKSGHIRRFRIVDGEEIPLNEKPFKIRWTTISNSTTVWVDYLDKSDYDIGWGFWKISPIEATKQLKAEFGEFKNKWKANTQ